MAKTVKKSTKAAGAAKKPPTKSEIYSAISESTELSKKQVAAVFDELSALIEKNLKARGPGMFTLPGLLKVVVQNKPAQKSRPVRNPATGEMIMSKPKPARKVVKVRPLKGLKEMV